MIRSASAGDLLERAARITWDVLVIGGGPAGSLAATLLARGGLQVLLIDARAFPRAKACGGCLNGLAVGILQHCGVGHVLKQAAAASLTSFKLACRHQHAEWPFAGSVAIHRGRFDEAMVQSAVAAGACLLESTRAVVQPDAGDPVREVILHHNGCEAVATARLVLCADGLSHSSLKRLPEFAGRVAPSSRIGLGGTMTDQSDNWPRGRLSMSVGRTGYVGLVRTGCGSLSLGAAIDPLALADGAAPADVLEQILTECESPVPRSLNQMDLRGTPLLTRRATRCAARRLLVLGDAAGYVEPFTGEGIAWALHSALLATPLARAACTDWREELATDWACILRRKVIRNQWTCQLLARLLRSPALAGLSLEVCRWLPVVPRRIMSQIGRRHSLLPPVLADGPLP